MAITNNQKTSKALRAFFSQQMAPLAERLKKEGVKFLDVERDVRESYYVSREKRSMSKADFEWGGCPGVEAFPQQLADMWKARGPKELATLAPELGKFAVALQDKGDQDADVSPFIYVMY